MRGSARLHPLSEIDEAATASSIARLVERPQIGIAGLRNGKPFIGLVRVNQAEFDGRRWGDHRTVCRAGRQSQRRRVASLTIATPTRNDSPRQSVRIVPACPGLSLGVASAITLRRAGIGQVGAVRRSSSAFQGRFVKLKRLSGCRFCRTGVSRRIVQL